MTTIQIIAVGVTCLAFGLNLGRIAVARHADSLAEHVRVLKEQVRATDNLVEKLEASLATERRVREVETGRRQQVEEELRVATQAREALERRMEILRVNTKREREP